MKGKHIEFLREQAKLTQSKMAEILNVSARTIAKWESDSDDLIAPVYASACQTSFENLILAPILRDCSKKIFLEIPSELVAIWIVRYSIFPIQYAKSELEFLSNNTNCWELILHENTARYQCLCDGNEEQKKCHWNAYCNKESAQHNDRVHKNLQQKSLTTLPLHSGQIVNLAGDDISNHPYKRIDGRINPHYHDQWCHSLLHVPYHIPHVSGPRPVALFSLQNKLTRDENNKLKVIKFDPGKTGTAYTEEDEKRAKDIIKKLYDEELKEVFDAFDYLPEIN